MQLQLVFTEDAGIYSCLCMLETQDTSSHLIQHPDFPMEVPTKALAFPFLLTLHVKGVVAGLGAFFVPPTLCFLFYNFYISVTRSVLSISHHCSWGGKKDHCCKEHPSLRSKCVSSLTLLTLPALGAQIHSGTGICVICGFVKLHLMGVFFPTPSSHC